jgi:hemerythrin
MVKRTQWIPYFSTGNATLDEQHQTLLTQCNALADCLGEPGQANEEFPVILEKLLANMREHFATGRVRNFV